MDEQEARNEVARLIRAGHPLIEEDRYTFVHRAYGVFPACGCALGAFYVGVRGIPDKSPYEYAGSTSDLPGFLVGLEHDFTVLRVRIATPTCIQKYYHISDVDTIAAVVNGLHLHAYWPRLAIADWLETGVEYENGESIGMWTDGMSCTRYEYEPMTSRQRPTN